MNFENYITLIPFHLYSRMVCYANVWPIRPLVLVQLIFYDCLKRHLAKRQMAALAYLADVTNLPQIYVMHYGIVIYWMMIISFIFHFIGEFVFIKGLRKVKNKGHESHPCMITGFYAPKNIKREYKKSKSIPPKIILYL